ncbi:lipopolysaccharide heptosyltransferase family protein [Aureibaculum marinum]|uniref:Lipopolysaccharide heptosyltransferase family protein n=1 Tax=Aureibaculum marinum TaxID=2487930 RepID=A0A3N4NZH2_9FLAO|nr:glycosyltransferase family 9 protein [Aureibaculum marinum]RPD98226.1 lipopolysaccharide heptosyltransferase family protein [Aureibaculum marinum]
MKKILIIQQKMIGDVLTSTMLCAYVKKYLPETEIHYLINENTEGVVVNNPNIDRVVFFKKEYRDSKWAFYLFLKSISKNKYDVVIDVYGKIESALISLFSGANVKISHFKWYSSFIYTHTLKPLRIKHSSMGLAIEHRLQLLKPIVPEFNPAEFPPKIFLTESEILEAKLRLESKGVSFSKPLVMISILGSSEIKSYPLQYMAEVMDAISKKGEVIILFNYMPSQLKLAEELYALCSPELKAKIRFDIFEPSLRSFLGILYHCDALVGNEGGAVNMAKALNVPTFSIFSPWIKKISWETFNANKANMAVHLNDYYQNESMSKKQLKKASQTLYLKFKPSLFTEKLDSFLKTNVFVNN